MRRLRSLRRLRRLRRLRFHQPLKPFEPLKPLKPYLSNLCNFTTFVRAALRARTVRANGRAACRTGADLGENRLLERSDTLAFTTLGHPVLRTCHFSYSFFFAPRSSSRPVVLQPFNFSTFQLFNLSTRPAHSSDHPAESRPFGRFRGMLQHKPGMSVGRVLYSL